MPSGQSKYQKYRQYLDGRQLSPEIRQACQCVMCQLKHLALLPRTWLASKLSRLKLAPASTNAFVWLLVLIDGVALGDIP